MPSHFFPYKCNRLPRVPSVTFLLVWRSSTQSDTAWANHSTANPRKVTARVLVWSQTCEWDWEVGTRQCRGQEYHWRYGLQKADVHFNKILMFPLEWKSWNPQILERSQVRMHRNIVGLWCPHHECLRDQVELNRTHSTNESLQCAITESKELYDGAPETTFQNGRLCVANVQSYGADSANSNGSWLGQTLLFYPMSSEVQGARGQDKVSPEAQSPGFPQEAGGGHQSRIWKGTWLQSSEHQSMSSCYFLGFSRMFKNFPLVISLDSSSPSW